MIKFSNNLEINECLNKLYKAKSGNNSLAIADVEVSQVKLYKLARIHWKELFRIFNEETFNEPDIRSDIIWSLRDIPEKGLINFFQDILLNHDDWEFRYAAIEVLSAYNGSDLVNTFVQALNDTDSTIQSCAVSYLEKFGDRRALSGLKNIIHDKALQKLKPGLVNLANCVIKKIGSSQK